MCIVLSGQDAVVEQARRQLEDLVRSPPPTPLLGFHLNDSNKVPVWAVLDYTNTKIISRELLLVKVSILGPEYLEDQLAGGPTLQPRWAEDTTTSNTTDTKLQQETALAQNFERSAHADNTPPTPITPSQALRLKHQHLQSISVLAKQFAGKIVDVSEHSVIVELTAKTTRVEAFLKLLKPFGILEAARTGLMVMPRTPFMTDEDDVDLSDDASGVDASSLPPG